MEKENYSDNTVFYFITFGGGILSTLIIIVLAKRFRFKFSGDDEANKINPNKYPKRRIEYVDEFSDLDSLKFVIRKKFSHENREVKK